jgi:transposase InsO family protein
MRLVERTFAPGMTVSLVARQNGTTPNQLLTWRRLAIQGALTAIDSSERVRVAFALDSCDREARSYVISWWPPSSTGLSRSIACHRPRMAHQQWHGLHRHRYPPLCAPIELAPQTIPLGNPQANGMAEALVRTIKRDLALQLRLPLMGS